MWEDGEVGVHLAGLLSGSVGDSRESFEVTTCCKNPSVCGSLRLLLAPKPRY